MQIRYAVPYIFGVNARISVFGGHGAFLGSNGESDEYYLFWILAFHSHFQ